MTIIIIIFDRLRKKISPTQMTMLLFSRRALDASFLDW